MSERRRLPDTRDSITRKIAIRHAAGETKIYITVGLYEDGKPGEVFLKADRMGTSISGLLDALAIALSIGLQSGVPLSHFTRKLANMRFEPEGQTGDPDLRYATSLVDVVARWLEKRFPEPRP
jgi:ribonucleoside-diphosphate reductase alpha chain